MKTNELSIQIEGLKTYRECMVLDECTRIALDRVIADMEDTFRTMIIHGLFNIKEV